MANEPSSGIAPQKRCCRCEVTKPIAEFPKKRQAKDGFSPWCKPCSVAYVRNALLADPEQHERRKAYWRQRYEARRAEMQARGRDAYYANREKRKRQVAEWIAANPERRRAISQSYKHRRRTTEGEGMTGRELAAWKREQPKVCYWCSAKCARGFVVDHYVPLAKGGKHEASNLVIACRPCNARKAAKDPIEFAHSVGRLL